MKKILILVGIAAIGVAGLVYASLAAAQDSTGTLKVSGMTCGDCAQSVENALQKIEGVKAAQVTLDDGQATVTFDSRKVKIETLIAAVSQVGGSEHQFTAEKIAECKGKVCNIAPQKTGGCCP